MGNLAISARIFSLFEFVALHPPHSHIVVMPLVNEIAMRMLHWDIASVVSQYLDDMDLISFCIAYAPLQPYFFARIKSLPILTHPFDLIQYDIERCQRLAHLVRLSAEENLTAFHKIPKTLTIRHSEMIGGQRPIYSLNTHEGELVLESWRELFSTITRSCPNITEFIVEFSHSKQRHIPDPQLPGYFYECRCADCMTSLTVDCIPPMPNLKKICFLMDILPKTQASIARIISTARILEFKYICFGNPLIDSNLIHTIQNTRSLQSLTVLSRCPVPALKTLITKLCSAFPTIRHLHIDDQSSESNDHLHVLEVIAALDLRNLSSFRYDATLYRALAATSNGAGDLLYPIWHDTLPFSMTSCHLMIPGYVGEYMMSNKDITLVKVFQGYPSMTHIELKDCTFLNDTSFGSIWECLPNLSELLIQDCSNITGESIVQSHGKGWTKLTKLDVSTCENITNNCIITIARTTEANRVHLMFCERPMAIWNPLVSRMTTLGYRVGHTYKPSSVVLLRGDEEEE
ncbi:hypothetical protein BGW37DRAFT_560060 [Umbelopsis sp. PMI_123]|nr:hypothetical protein BGW37DRAFT_560060 [Umbelopsis sp. PMI_123]